MKRLPLKTAEFAPVAPDMDDVSLLRRRDLVARWLSRRSARTTEAYTSDLRGFAAFIGAQDLVAAAGLLLTATQGDANAIADGYRAALVERGLAPATVNRRLSALRSLVALARVSGLVSWELSTLSERSSERRDVRGPGSLGTRKLLASAASGAAALRDVAMIRVMHDIGLRRSELVGLDLEDLDVQDNRVRVRNGKGQGGQAEWLSLPSATMQIIEAYVTQRGSSPGPLFLRRDHRTGPGRLTGRGIAKILKELSTRAEIPTVRPHGLRHAGASAVSRVLGSAEAVMRYGRWKNLAVATRYLDSVANLQGKAAEAAAATLG